MVISIYIIHHSLHPQVTLLSVQIQLKGLSLQMFKFYKRLSAKYFENQFFQNCGKIKPNFTSKHPVISTG